MDIFDSVGWGVVVKDYSEEVVIWVEDEVDYEKYSSVVKGVKYEFGVVFGGIIGVMGLL